MRRFLSRTFLAFSVAVILAWAGQSEGAVRLEDKTPEVKADCAPPKPECCDKVCIDYRYRRPCRKACCECAPPQKLTLCVKDPCCCDYSVKVPVCIPSCCKGKPVVCERCGLFGRGVVTYEWCCGFKLTVTFKTCGNVVVTYFGS